MINCKQRAKELIEQYTIGDAIAHAVQCMYMSPSLREEKYWSEVTREIKNHEKNL